MKILVTGGSGMLGHRLMRLAKLDHDVWGTYHTQRVDIDGCAMVVLDVTNEIEVRDRLSAIAPDIVIHTAALTDVDECETAPDKAELINGTGTRFVAATSEQLGARFVYISTDYVFDGARGDYVEDDRTNPVNQYGKSKLLGETWALKLCSRALILRTTMYGLKIPPKVGMMESLVAALRNGKPLARFVDQFFNPLYTGQLSQIILRLIDLERTGLYHVGASDKVSRLQFAERVAALWAAGGSEIRPVPFRQIENLAPRPRDTSLACRRLQALMAAEPPGLQEGLGQLRRDWAERKNDDRGYI